METIIAKIGKAEFPVRVKFEYQRYRPAEEVDGMINPEVHPHVEIKSISFGGYDLDDVLNPLAVEKQARKQCYDVMLLKTETEQ